MPAEESTPSFVNHDVPGIFVPTSFRIQPADKNLVTDTHIPPPPKEPPTGVSIGKLPFVDALPFLDKSWSGPGFNQIFRPQSSVTPIRHGLPPAESSILELNLTHEIWTFGKDLGDIPNRGAGTQKDINLDGLPYTQTVLDITDSRGGRLNIDSTGALLNAAGNKITKTDPPNEDRPREIHFETGMFLNVPRTLANTEPSMVRMASIPHGTTMNLQGRGAQYQTQPDPNIVKESITPFPVSSLDVTSAAFIRTGRPQDIDRPDFFPKKASQKAEDDNTARLPQKLGIHKGFIDQTQIDDPNTLMRIHNQGKTITDTIVWRLGSGFFDHQSNSLQKAISLLTKAAKVLGETNTTLQKDANVMKSLKEPPFASITESLKETNNLLQSIAGASNTNLSNIAFLDGPESKGSADSSSASVAVVKCIFWISRVEYTFSIDEWTPKKDNATGKATNTLRVRPDKSASGEVYSKGTVPTFAFPDDKPLSRQKVTVSTPQLQYTQTVMLRFAGQIWRHMALGTVVPMDDIVLRWEGNGFTSDSQKLWETVIQKAKEEKAKAPA